MHKIPPTHTRILAFNMYLFTLPHQIGYRNIDYFKKLNCIYLDNNLFLFKCEKGFINIIKQYAYNNLLK